MKFTTTKQQLRTAVAVVEEHLGEQATVTVQVAVTDWLDNQEPTDPRELAKLALDAQRNGDSRDVIEVDLDDLTEVVEAAIEITGTEISDRIDAVAAVRVSLAELSTEAADDPKSLADGIARY